ncbi:hypothetical protein MRB53_009995 [Persea americana]|uniref:Uncharacterized protein n=1 Tax=Persea americana TaxID=3435 RepID=A0ACC2LRD8_PERAE|nr:hypothetical protein MRB53_009995 [Persea americana]
MPQKPLPMTLSILLVAAAAITCHLHRPLHLPRSGSSHHSPFSWPLSIFLAAAAPSSHRLSPATHHLSGPLHLSHANPSPSFLPYARNNTFISPSLPCNPPSLSRPSPED